MMLHHLECLKHGLPGYEALLWMMLLFRLFKTHFTMVDQKSLDDPEARRLRETADNSLKQIKTLDTEYY
jgi:hypothetical protein